MGIKRNKEIGLDFADVSYSSSNTGIATVNTGIITAVTEGTATITVSYTEGGITKSDTVEVTVTPVTPETYIITASACLHGSISPSGNVTVNQGSDKLFTITPNTGYSINDVLVDGSSVGAVSSYTFTNVTENHTISATFCVTAGPVHNLTKNTYYNTIQATVNAASPGDTIIVRDGTYTENVDVNKDHLTIKSENGAEVTIVQAANPDDKGFFYVRPAWVITSR